MHTVPHHDKLKDITSRLLAPGKGVLAADESVSTMNKRLASVSVAETEEMRRVYRQLLFAAPGIEEYLSGVIMFDASMRNETDDGIPFPDILTARGIIPGIKVDKGTVGLQGFEGEVVTEGLDGLHERLVEYQTLGARFAKWRAVIAIDTDIPTDECIEINAVMLARYAALCQEVGIVPMVEPEVLMQGTHDIVRAEAVTMRTLQVLFATLRRYRVDLEGLILKTSMVLASDGAAAPSSAEAVADATLRTLHLSVPHDTAGIVFLSGGQTPVRATENLQAIAAHGDEPWPITFSYSRAIEEPVLAAWRGDSSQEKAAQRALLHRLKMNAFARDGKYEPSLETGEQAQ